MWGTSDFLGGLATRRLPALAVYGLSQFVGFIVLVFASTMLVPLGFAWVGGDAARRDFTMNALSVSADGRVFDYAGGLADLAARRVRFIGEARQRIREDYLRLLRFYRFHAAYGVGAMDAEAFSATILEREGLAGLSRERIRMELMKLLAARRAAEVARDLSEAGLLQMLIGGIGVPARTQAEPCLHTGNYAEEHAHGQGDRPF